MKKQLTQIIILGIAAMALGCSHRYREVGVEINGEQLASKLNESLGVSANGTSGADADTEEFRQMAQTPGASVFFTEGPGDFGDARTIAPMLDYSFLGHPELTEADIVFARVFFVDVPREEGSDNGIFFHLKTASGVEIKKVFLNTHPDDVKGDFLDEQFGALLSNGTDRIIIHSNDVKDDQFAQNIQLEISLEYPEDPENPEIVVGKVSTLIGLEIGQ